MAKARAATAQDAPPQPHSAPRIQDTAGSVPSGSRRLKHELGFARRAMMPRLLLANTLSRLFPPFSFSTLRALLYRRMGWRIGARVSFCGPVSVVGSGREIYARLAIGEGSLISVDVSFNLDDSITIGRNVSIGPGTHILTGSHLLGPGSCRMSPNVTPRPVVIEDGAWIGAYTLILPGVVIGHGSVISAGAVVTENVPPNMYAAGNPAKAIQELPWGDL